MFSDGTDTNQNDVYFQLQRTYDFYIMARNNGEASEYSHQCGRRMCREKWQGWIGRGGATADCVVLPVWHSGGVRAVANRVVHESRTEEG